MAIFGCQVVLNFEIICLRHLGNIWKSGATKIFKFFAYRDLKVMFYYILKLSYCDVWPIFGYILKFSACAIWVTIRCQLVVHFEILCLRDLCHTRTSRGTGSWNSLLVKFENTFYCEVEQNFNSFFANFCSSHDIKINFPLCINFVFSYVISVDFSNISRSKFSVSHHMLYAPYFKTLPNQILNFTVCNFRLHFES